MKTNYLISHKWRKIGWMLFLPSLAASILSMIFEGIFTLKVPVFQVYSDAHGANLFNLYVDDIYLTVITALLIISLLLIAFSKEKEEDEYISEIRMNSLAWAVIINYFILLIANLTIWGFAFFNVMIYNMFTPLLIFVMRYHYLLYKLRRSQSNEE